MASPATGMAAPHSHKASPSPVLSAPPGQTSQSARLDGSGMKFVVISSRWHEADIVRPLVDACLKELKAKGVPAENVTQLQVMGVYELPMAAARVIQAKGRHIDGIICIGCMIKGSTLTYEFVSEAATMAIMKLNIKTDTPVVWGLLTAKSHEHAKKCASEMGACVAEDASMRTRCSHGVEWAQEAIELAQLVRLTDHMKTQKKLSASQCERDKCTCACHCTDCKCQSCSCQECSCVSCQEHEHTMLTGLHGQDSTCSGCNKSSENCECKGCNCASCAQKSTPLSSKQGACSGCGQTKTHCECNASQLQAGVTNAPATKQL